MKCKFSQIAILGANCNLVSKMGCFVKCKGDDEDTKNCPFWSTYWYEVMK